MKRNSKGKLKKSLPHPALDLFGEVPVTHEEVFTWCEIVAGIPRDSWRLRWYLASWNVPAKIRAAKLAGEYDAIMAAATARCAPAALYSPFQ